MVRLGRSGWTGGHPIHEGARHVSPQPSSRRCRSHCRDGDRTSRRLGVRFRYVVRQASPVRSGDQARSGERVRSKQVRSKQVRSKQVRSKQVRSKQVRSGSAAASKSAARQSGALRSVTLPAMVAALATQLGVSHSAAQRVFNQLDAVSGTGGVDPASPAFAAIAHDLGVSPAQLAAALGAAKRAARQSVAGR